MPSKQRPHCVGMERQIYAERDMEAETETQVCTARAPRAEKEPETQMEALNYTLTPHPGRENNLCVASCHGSSASGPARAVSNTHTEPVVQCPSVPLRPLTNCPFHSHLFALLLRPPGRTLTLKPSGLAPVTLGERKLGQRQRQRGTPRNPSYTPILTVAVPTPVAPPTYCWCPSTPALLFMLQPWLVSWQVSKITSLCED